MKTQKRKNNNMTTTNKMNVHFSSQSDTRANPQWLFDELGNERAIEIRSCIIFRSISIGDCCARTGLSPGDYPLRLFGGLVECGLKENSGDSI